MVSKKDIERIVNADHHDPFTVLGQHDLGRGSAAVRAFVPGADQLFLLSRDGQRETAMALLAKPGLFEVKLKGWDTSRPYRLRAVFKKVEHEFYDPYSFVPFLSEYDLYLFNEGTHRRIHTFMGAHLMTHQGVPGTAFSVWAPNAKRVSVVGDFNRWDGKCHAMRVRGSSGVWELFIPGIPEGAVYKYEIKSREETIILKKDPVGFGSEMRPKTASVVADLGSHRWEDSGWMEQRRAPSWQSGPVSIYEVHLGSWRLGEEGGFLSYRELADQLVPYLGWMGFTHLQLMPVMAHPFDPSWGYQVSCYYAPTFRHGPPEGLMYLVDKCHGAGIGVIFDWVPGHFPRDDHGPRRFDGSALYEYEDTTIGEHKGWGTLVFNYSRHEVKSFLLSNALYWLEMFHADGLRVDAVSSMLYRDYDRNEGEWKANIYGGREHIEAIDFLKSLNEVVHFLHPGTMMVAEESTAWPGVTLPTYAGGLGFGLKWNMGWMHDILKYMSLDPVFRRYHQDKLTFALYYAFHENFVLPLSHDEVVHGKRSLLSKMPGDRWQQFANLRLLFGFQFGHPGKKLIFMGGEFGQENEWYHAESLHWLRTSDPLNRGVQLLVRDLNHLLSEEASLHQLDFHHTGFEWIDFSDHESSIISFIRKARDPGDHLVFVCNFTPMVRRGYLVGVPFGGFYEELLNTDSHVYGGSDAGNSGGVHARPHRAHGRDYSLSLTLPPLGMLVLKPRR